MSAFDRNGNRHLIQGIDFGHTHARLVYRRVGQEDWVALDHYGEFLYPALACRDLAYDGWLTGRPAEQALQGNARVVPHNRLKSALLRPGASRDERSAVLHLFQRLHETVMEGTRASGVAARALAVPLPCSAREREAIRRESGLGDLLLVSEPEAAVLGYGIDEQLNGSERRAMVFNMGGGSCWCAILHLREQHGSIYAEVLSEERHAEACGDTFDRRVLQQLERQYGLEARVQALPDEEQRAAAQAELSMRLRQMVQALHQGQAEETSAMLSRLDLEVQLRREQLAGPLADLAITVQEVLSGALTSAGIQAREIDYTLPVGGMTRLSPIRNVLRQMPYVEEGPMHAARNTDLLCIATGAARYAAMHHEHGRRLPFIALERPAFGVMVEGGRFDVVIPTNAQPPISRAKVYHAPVPGALAVRFEVYQGYSRRAQGNRSVGLVTYHFPDGEDFGAIRRNAVRLRLTLTLHSLDELTVTVEDIGLAGESAREMKRGTFRMTQAGEWSTVEGGEAR